MRQRQMLVEKAVLLVKDRRALGATRLDPLWTRAPVRDKLGPILVVTGGQEQLSNGSPSTVQRALDPSVPNAEGLAREVEATGLVGRVEARIQILKLSRTEECEGT